MLTCSHGLPFEVKCRGCFEDAMKALRPIVAEKPIEKQCDELWLSVFDQSGQSPEEVK